MNHGGGITVSQVYCYPAERCKDGCWRFPTSPTQIYGSVGLGLAGEHLAHRTAWVLKHGKIRDGMMICHKCDVPACINPKHLYLGNAHTNHQDACARGRNFKMDYNESALYLCFPWSWADLFLDKDLRTCIEDVVTIVGSENKFDKLIRTIGSEQ